MRTPWHSTWSRLDKRIILPEDFAPIPVAFALHTIVVYWCALHLCPWLVGRWFAWIMPLIHLFSVTRPADWYLRHLELMSIIPAIGVGYLLGGARHSLSRWVWLLPTVIMFYKLMTHSEPHSVLVDHDYFKSFKYFFDIEREMPTFENIGVSDPRRTLAQMTITAPFYSGFAYSAGAWVSFWRKKVTEGHIDDYRGGT